VDHRWAGLAPRARLAILVGVPAVAALATLVALLAHTSQTPLFATSLHPEQLQEVEERLAAWNVPFAPLADNVSVASAQRNALLLRLSLAGVPHAHLETEDEALATVGALTPQSVIDEQALAGKEGDVAASLRDVAGVQDARVIIVPAKPGEFADENATPASASVRLRLAPGVRLTEATIAGVRAFVAAAVAGLVPARVTILDDRGVALGDGPAGDADGAADLQAALQSALDSAFGAGVTIVRVRTERDRTSTAVFVDNTHAGDLLAVRDLAAATVGYDAQRGDTLAVQAVDFSHAPSARKDIWWLLYGGIVPLLPTLAIVAGMLAALRLAGPSLGQMLRTLVERARVAQAARSAPELSPARVRALLEKEPPHAAAAVISALPAATAAAVLELYPQHERSAIVKRMHRAASPLAADISDLLGDG
jgi:flagellar biosynthesis/type III secretory pathway M-ring protein FliF/YscJ